MDGAGRPMTRSMAPLYTMGLSWSMKSRDLPPFKTTRGRMFVGVLLALAVMAEVEEGCRFGIRALKHWIIDFWDHNMLDVVLSRVEHVGIIRFILHVFTNIQLRFPFVLYFRKMSIYNINNKQIV